MRNEERKKIMWLRGQQSIYIIGSLALCIVKISRGFQYLSSSRCTFEGMCISVFMQAFPQLTHFCVKSAKDEKVRGVDCLSNHFPI